MQLQSEIARAAAQDPSQDTLPTALHDLKLTWSFMQSGFVASSFQRYFPSLESRPPDDCLPSGTYSRSSRSIRQIDNAIHDTFRTLSTPPRASLDTSQRMEAVATPTQRDDSTTTSFAVSSPADITPTKNLSLESLPSPISDERYKPADDAPLRDLKQEPWFWANTLVAQCGNLIGTATMGKSTAKSADSLADFSSLDPGGASLFAERSVGKVSTRPAEHELDRPDHPS